MIAKYTGLHTSEVPGIGRCSFLVYPDKIRVRVKSPFWETTFVNEHDCWRDEGDPHRLAADALALELFDLTSPTDG